MSSASMQPESDPLTMTSVFRRRQVTLDHLLTHDVAMQRVLVRAGQLAPLDSAVMILGEPGTGKSLLAQALHNASNRAGRPFRILGPGDVTGPDMHQRVFGDHASTGLLRGADGGSLILDELQAWPEAAQLLMEQFVDYREVPTSCSADNCHINVRLIATVSGAVEAESVVPSGVAPGLYQRLRGCELRLPSLATRRADLEMLAIHFLRRFCARSGKAVPVLSDDVLEAIRNRRWYGNLRELEQAMRAAAVAAESTGRLHAADLPTPLQPMLPGGQLPFRLDEVERWAYLRALQASRGQRRQAMELLGVASATFYRKARAFGLLDPPATQDT